MACVKLLLDQNLSRFLVQQLAEAFPGTRHMAELGLERADDEVVWQHAARVGHIVVGKDVDFHQRSILRGLPPKVVWLGLGNCATGDVLAALHGALNDLAQFAEDPEQSLFMIRRREARGHLGEVTGPNATHGEGGLEVAEGPEPVLCRPAHEDVVRRPDRSRNVMGPVVNRKLAILLP